MAGPCNWPVTYPASITEVGWSVEDQIMYEAAAAEFLWNWTLKAFGVCRVTVRSCRSGCASPSLYWMSTVAGQQWFALACGICGDNCTCGLPTSLRLPGPVIAVTQIIIDGTVLPASSYRVDNQSLLVRMDGSGWPTCQDMSLPLTEPNTWAVSFEQGREVPAGGQIAAGILALELYRASRSDPSCRLPQRVQTLTRQGVTVALLDPFEDLGKGRTGIWVIDSWVSSIVDPIRPGRVFSPDVPRPKWRSQTSPPVPLP